MKLRDWQVECIDKAINKYKSGSKHFLTLATPGAGKTIMASHLAKMMLEKDLVDLIICFSPSLLVSIDFSKTLTEVIGENFDGRLGSKGHSLTYQNLPYLDDNFWKLFRTYRVLVIFDEIHHCSGSGIKNSNAWGHQIIVNIQGVAAFTLALTGTPWRSDQTPIVLSSYRSNDQKIICDYVYGLREAIRDKVCRVPKIIAVDNDNISIVEDDEHKYFSSFKALLNDSLFSYQEVVTNERLILHIVKQANAQLNEIRLSNTNAGGLIVASSLEHANLISQLMAEHLNELPTIVSYKEKDSTNIINQYRFGDSKWILSIGMISEGTNIPRLQVAVHLTTIKTEMHFRQLSGRNLRLTSSPNQEAYLYMPAEPKLVEFANRLAQDIPEEANVIQVSYMKESFDGNDEVHTGLDNESKATPNDLAISLSCFSDDNHEPNNLLSNECELSKGYERMMGIFGKFQHETLELSLANFE